MQPKFEIADLLEKLGDGIENFGLNSWQCRTLWAIKRCRTAQMGGHVDACDACGNITVSYNSCRNRHWRNVAPPSAKVNKCRCCKVGNLVTIASFDGRGPVAEYLGVGQNQSNHES